MDTVISVYEAVARAREAVSPDEERQPQGLLIFLATADAEVRLRALTEWAERM